MAIDGAGGAVNSAKVFEWCNDRSIEFRAFSSDNEPTEVESELLGLWRKGNGDAPILMFLYENGRVDSTSVPATSDEMIVYLEGANSE